MMEVRTLIQLPYAMPGCMRRVVGHFRRFRLGSDVSPAADCPAQELFNRVEWMEMGSHALEIPQLRCIGNRNVDTMIETLLEHYGISREIHVNEKQFGAVAIGRFRMKAGKSVSDQQTLLVQQDGILAYRSQFLPDPVVSLDSGRNTIYITQLPSELNLPPLELVMKAMDSLCPTQCRSALIPRIHISRWDSYADYLGLQIKGTNDTWTLGYAEAHTILTLDPESPETVEVPLRTMQIRPPFLVWVRRRGGHFEFPTLVGILAAEDFA